VRHTDTVAGTITGTFNNKGHRMVTFTWGLLFLILAAICFFLDAIQLPVTPRLNKFSLGWCFVVIAVICGFHPFYVSH
jgi:hypothetical protein